MAEKEYIEREAAIVRATKCLPDDFDAYNVKVSLRAIPAADVVEVRNGSWIVKSKLYPLPWDTVPLDWDRYDEKTHSEWEDYYECSECHKGEYAIKPRWHYCPDCGAKMDGGQDE